MTQEFNQLNLFNDFVNKYGPSNVKMLPHNPGMQPSVFTNAGSVEPGIPVNWANQWYGYSKPGIQPKVRAVSGPIKGTGGPLLSGAELLRLWYGKDEHGAVGPGRALLEQTPWGQAIFGKPQMTPEQIKSNEITNKFIKDVFGGKSNKNDNTDKNADAILKGVGAQSGNKTTTTKPAGTSQQQAVALAQQLVSNNGIQEPVEQNANTQAINDYIQQLKDINQPYVNALKNYVDNYNNMLDQRQRAARFWQGAASLTGNPAWAKIGEQYNTLSNEANRVNAIKQLQDAQAGDLNAINEVMGNMAIAKEMDLPYEAAFANKNLLTALTANRRMLTDWEKAQLAAELKRYGIDVGYKKAIDVQGMRGQNALDVANTYMGGGVAPGLNAQGNIANYFK